MDIGRDGSFHGYPAQVWPTITPASQDYSDLKMNSTNGLDNGFNNGTIGTSFGGWESSNLWSDDRVSNTHKPGLYDTLFMNNMWSGIPCSDLLALADPAIAVTRKGSGDGYDNIIGGGCVGIGRVVCDDNEVNVQPQSQDVGCVPDSPQNEHPDETRYLFDLNSIPILTEPELITSSPSELPPVTPKPTRRAGRRGKLSDIIYSTQVETTDQDVINLEQPELIIEQSQNDLEVEEDFEEGSSDDLYLKKTPQLKQRTKIRKCRNLEQSKLITEQSQGDILQLEIDEDFEDGSSDGLDFKKTPQPKQRRRRRRRKHRKVEQPKVITEQSQDDVRQLEVDEDFEEGSSDNLDLTKTPQPKERRRKHRPKVVIEGQTKSANKRTPKPDGSKGNKKYDATGTPTNKGTNEVTDRTISRPVRKTCRRRINFGDEWDFEGSDFEFIFESQVLSPITPAKSETKKDAENKCSKAKQKIDFSRSNIVSRDNSSCSTSAGFKKDASGICYKSLEAYRSKIPTFPSTYKRKRTELRYTSIISWAKSSVWSPERLTLNGVNHQSYKNILGFGNLENIRKKRSKGIKRMRDLKSLTQMIEGKQHTCMEALAADFGFNRAAKKRTKRNSTMSSSSYYNHWFLTNYIGLQSNFRWKNTYDMDALINQFENLGLKNQRVEQDQKALVPYLTRYQEKKALVPYTTRYRQKNSVVLYQQNRSLVPFEDSDYEEKSGKLRPKVELDDETDRVWRLLLEDINSQGIDGIDEDNSKYWEEERNVFSGRAASFIARMHLVQGDRRFSRWKGSVVDSVTGVFLTQNVSDHLSSSAFINLAARYPLKSKSSTEPPHEEKSSISVSEICQLDLEETTRWQDNSNLQPAQPHDSTTPQHADYEEKGVVNSNELESIGYSHEQNEGVSEDHVTSEIRLPPKDCDTQKVNMLGAIEAEYIELREGRTSMHKKHEEKCVSQQSEISSESANQTTLETVSENSNIVSNQDINDNNCNVQKILGIENSSAEISEVIESNNIVENSTDTVHELIESNSNENDNLQATVSGINKGSTLARKGKTRKGKKVKVDWDSLRKSAQVKKKRERTLDTMDSLDYEAVRCADVDEISDAIKDRGMNNMLAERIKEFLNRLVKDHGSIDLEWLRDVPPDKAKEYLLSFRGLGLKSVECVRLLTLHHLAFPVDTNVGRIAVRLGWVPLQPLPESLQLHLLELYPILETIQKYLWPRLCKLDQKTLYELHYQMITFGKVFCTKNKPNCNSCPMKGECRHFASAFASARLSLPATEEKSIVTGTENRTHGQTPTWTTNQPHLSLPPPDDYLQQEFGIQNHDPFVEEPTTPEPIIEVPATPELEQTQQEFDIEDFGEDTEEIPTITLNMEAFTQNLQTYMENNMELADGDMSRALVALTSEAASIPTPKLKNVSQLRTEHQVYELPDSHPLLKGLDKREPDDPCSYLLAIWTPGETAESIQPPKGQCNSQESDTLCHKETCFWCNSMREANSQTVRGTLLIPCRTAMRGSFPLNGTYFQVNEVFADHDSSLNPINVPRSWLWNLPRRTVYFGTSIPTIFRGLTTEGIQYCFWRGFVCVRGFDQKTRAPRPLMARLHFPVSKLKRSRGKPDED
uniref:DNA glycosylase/AP lyase ROS1-like n=1 Tax=Erigeron canadensis TaxID=72917 RepID=UPI001CB9B3CA|nr:DNA glycosylase/AP lyase ROS1-like [Erigeron canadensis]